MGFFLIDKTSEKPFEGYFETVEDSLVYIYDNDINQRYILVEGDIESIPRFFTESTQYVEYTKDNLRSGKLAQEYFKELAKKNGLIAEPIPQDQESYAAYDILKDENGKKIRVKRADFNIKNCILTEVEVKCLAFYPCGKEKKDSFFINYSELKGLQNLNNETDMETVFAVFKKSKENRITDKVPYLISIDKIFELNRKEIVQYCQKRKSFIVPVESAEKGLDILINRKRK